MAFEISWAWFSRKLVRLAPTQIFNKAVRVTRHVLIIWCTFHRYKLAYAEVLHRWGLLYARANLLKYARAVTGGTTDDQRGVQFVTECGECSRACQRGARCPTCRRLAFTCAVCRVSVRGSANFCLVCGHGGHTTHLLAWFRAGNILCPTGCGCRCPHETASLLAVTQWPRVHHVTTTLPFFGVDWPSLCRATQVGDQPFESWTVRLFYIYLWCRYNIF